MRRRKRKPAKVALEFNHAMVYVRRVAPALHFYRHLLGFKLIEQHQWRGLPVYARLRSPRGRTTLALHVREPGQRLPKTEGIRLYFECQDLERVCRRLASAGAKFLQKPKLMPWGWKHAYLKDPDGHELSLYWAGRKRLRRSKM